MLYNYSEDILPAETFFVSRREFVKLVKKFSALLALLFSASFTSSAQETAPPVIEITPRLTDSRVKVLRDYLADENYDPEVHARLSLRASEAALQEGQSRRAEKLLYETYKYIDGSSAENRAAKATLQFALASLAKKKGDLDQRLEHSLRAHHVLSEGDPGKPWALLKLANAYAEAAYQNPRSNYRIAAIRLANDVRNDQNVHATVRDYAEILGISFKASNRAMAVKQAGQIDKIVDKPGQKQEIIAIGLIAQARLYAAGGLNKKAQEILKRLEQEDIDLPTLEAILIDNEKAVFDGGREAARTWESIRPEGLPPSLFAGQASRKFPSLLSGAYVEVSYCINPDGVVEDINIIDTENRAWADRIVNLMAERQFIGGKKDEACRFRYEKISVESKAEKITGSRIDHESADHFLVVTDLLKSDIFDRTLINQDSR